jgi:hypothetical protein
VRIGERTSKGYSRSDLADPWSRYVPGVTDVTQTGKDGHPVSRPHIGTVTSVTPSQERTAELFEEAW